MLRDERLGSITAWAEANPDLRAMLITSSLVNPLAPVDGHSDLDLELILLDHGKYAADDGWLQGFGEPIAIFNDADAGFGQRSAMKMVLFEDHGKVDFTLHDVTGFAAQVGLPGMPAHWDIGYKVLVDKDGLTKDLKPPTYQASIIKRPTREQFEKLLFDFWWDTTYVVKCLDRGDLFYAKYMSETIIRTNYLVPLVEWHIADQHDWAITTNKHGRLFRKHLPDALWSRVEKTFSGAEMAENRRALEVMMDLVHELGVPLAARLDYAYPLEMEERIRKFNE